jgi:hypothetical protein
MAINRVSQSSIQQAFPKFNTVWDGRSAVGSMDTIGVTTLNASTSSITFSSIPQTYSHLQIRLFANSTSNPDIFYTFNGDTGNNYTRHYIYGAGSGTGAAGSSLSQASGSVGYAPISSNTNVFGSTVLDVLDYTNTNKNTTTRSLSGYVLDSSGFIVMYSGVWLNTSAITSISIFPNQASASSFGQYTSAALYGIK